MMRLLLSLTIIGLYIGVLVSIDPTLMFKFEMILLHGMVWLSLVLLWVEPIEAFMDDVAHKIL